ncbi:MAG: hypothetical protein A2W61_08300 [Deltaproteobacteria bacterium RIFCSPLOWO2_01_44_7]|nr:MAG: hypothetical protein A2712_02260 [Deltaproteobacteria bacterium RIFCSPHIGHO2_01_FULL_43_49]OGQ15052.1 MAG: hypothetical protein A3D22_03220 [Deltaproteobacteria bacterium RIFCSPHIGHO2_02_FULL_44_53]OGQ27329.1 MAG: hypothetical protein A3D98_02855 [Deltaproteobacteria bacterium RIFCSPHIGHO2_12_FULL_44_21]OGQ31569.1 MAG: hypothetical protein A2979_04380 [Deltaproteobacteria bacterium RIFCSPLOWO2_01_FULL_45_74]OGQ42620.1 MAG: hypothetical protein A2W61_08300 [Deltaproteobacteria bacterium 
MISKEPKILLVYPPNQLMPIETPRPDGSLGPLYLASALEQAGFEVDILDASVGSTKDNLSETFFRTILQPNGLMRIGMSTESLKTFVDLGKYNIVGIHSNFTPQTRMALEVASCVKEVNPNILTVTGGVNARSLAERFLRSGLIDVVALAEGEKTIVDLVRALAAEQSFKNVDGISFMSEGKMTTNPLRTGQIHGVLDELPFPAWHKLPFDKYEQIASPHGVIAKHNLRYAPIMTSRGCPYHCSYCHISIDKTDPATSGNIGNYRIKSVDRVLEEMSILKSLKVKKLYFEDDSLLAKKSRVKEIFEKVLGMGFEIANVNGVNLVHFLHRSQQGKLCIDRDYLELLHSAGFDQIVFPVESASQRILDKYATGKLNHTVLDVAQLVKIATDVGILCPINMMIGFPDETEAEMMQSIELGKKLVNNGAPYCTFFIPIPFPGSSLFELAIRGGYLEQDFDTDLLNWKNAVMKNTIVPPERIVALRDWAWRTVNTEEHVQMRLKQSTASRWSDH